MSAIVNALVMIYLQIPDSIKVGGLDLFYLLVLGCLLAIFACCNKETTA